MATRNPGTLAAAMACAAVLSSLVPTSAAGQAVRVSVHTQVEQAPVAGAVVTLLDGDRAVDEGLTTVIGERTLHAPLPGTYRIRVRRIGFAPELSAPVAIGAGETRVLRLEVASRRVSLPPVVVESREKQCARGDRPSIAAAALWEQVATALTASEISVADSLVRTRVHVFERVLATDGDVEREETRLLGTGGARPFIPLEPAALSRAGYMQRDGAGDLFFYAPDARILLSPEFEADHCFQLVRGAGDADAMLGLAFSPVTDRKVVDVAGTLWVSPTTLELRSLEFRYVGARFPAPAPRAGGRIEFERLPSGAWLVRHWAITMPRYAAVRRGRRPRLTGYVEQGGDAASFAGDGRGVEEPARIAGTVWDSLGMRPLAGASIWSQTAARTTTADAAGAFVLDSLPPGEHLLVAGSPQLDSVGLQVARVAEAIPGGGPPIALASPSLATLAARLCGRAGAVPAGTGLLFGTVREAASGALVANALVEISWLRLGADAERLDAGITTREARTDSTGAYAACGVPVDTTLHVTAHSGDSVRSGTIYLELEALRIARRDLVTAGLVAGGGALRGLVTDSAGRPLEEVGVTIDGAATEARTGSAGEFLLADAPLGTRTVVVRRPGFAPVYSSVSITPRDTPYVRIEMSSARLLSAVEVRAERVSRTLAEVARRRRSGSGHFLDAEEARALPTFESLFRGIPLVRVATGAAGGFRLSGPTRSVGGGGCPMAIFIDGRKGDAEMLRLYSLKSVVAVEVYARGSQVPMEFQPFTNGCGAALIWTEELG